REGQDLERHAPAERDLDGLIDNPHAAPANLAYQAKVTQGAFRLDLWIVRGGYMEDLDRGQHGPQNGGELRIAPGILLDLRLLAGAEPFEDLIDDLAHESFRRGVLHLEDVAHSCASVMPPSNRIRCSRSSARPFRLLAVAGSTPRRHATSALESPSK